MIRVLYLVTRADLGGAQIHILDLLRGLQHVIEPMVGVGEEGYFTEEVRKLGVPFYVVRDLVHPIAPLHDVRALLAISRLIRHARPNIVHAHTSKAGVVGRLAARAAGTPSVFTAHTWCFAEGTSWKWRLAGVPAERLAGMMSSAVINVSEANRDLALWNRVCSAKRMVTIRNGICDTRERARPESAGVPRIVMVARCAKQKDHSLLLRALASIDRSATVQFVGDGPLAHSLKSEAERLDVAGKVEFLGDRPDVAAILARAHIFALASKWEGFPLSILEAMRAGLPVVASHVGGVAEAVVHGETGFLVECGDVETFGKRLSVLLDAPQLRLQMGQQGRLCFEQRFTLRRMLNETLSVYQQVLNGRFVRREPSPSNSPSGQFSFLRD